jgi:penicillin G amidase
MVRLLSRLLAAVAGSTLMLPSAMPAETAENLQARALAALSQIEGQLTLPGLSEPVEVLRDRWGVPHIYARNQDDLFFAQGVVAA